METKHLWLNLGVVFCLMVGSTAFFFMISAGIVPAGDSIPPGDVINGLDALEAARKQGPEAVVALLK